MLQNLLSALLLALKRSEPQKKIKWRRSLIFILIETSWQKKGQDIYIMFSFYFVKSEALRRLWLSVWYLAVLASVLSFGRNEVRKKGNFPPFPSPVSVIFILPRAATAMNLDWIKCTFLPFTPYLFMNYVHWFMFCLRNFHQGFTINILLQFAFLILFRVWFVIHRTFV